LLHGDDDQAYDAAVRLGELGDEEAVPALVSVVLGGARRGLGYAERRGGYVHIAAAEALGRIGGQEAIAALRKCLRSQQYGLQQAARAGLRGLGVAADFRDLNWQRVFVDSNGRINPAFSESDLKPGSHAKVEFAIELGNSGYLELVECEVTDLSTGDPATLLPEQKRAMVHWFETGGFAPHWSRASDRIREHFL
jgi:hypothetical protein